MKEPTIEDYMAWWCQRRVRTHGRAPAKSSIHTRTVRVSQMTRWAGGFPELVASLADPRRVDKLIYTASETNSPGSLRAFVYALKDLGAWAESLDLEADAVKDLEVPSQNPAPPIDTYTPDEMTLFKEASFGRELRWGCFINFLAETGRRVGEALSLEWGWFRLDDEPPHIQLPFSKAGTPQYIPLTPRLRTRVFTPENIASLKATTTGRNGTGYNRDPAVHPFPWSYSTVRTRFGGTCDILNIEDRGFHNFRHTVITNRLASGMPLQAVAALAGHSSSAITDSRYNHTNALHFAELLEDS